MGNLQPSTSHFWTGATPPDHACTERFIVETFGKSITYYYAPYTEAGSHTANDCEPSRLLHQSAPLSPQPLPFSLSTFEDVSSSTLLDSASHTLVCPPKSYSASTSRPLLVFFSWLGARPGAVAKYRDLYLNCGMDVLLVQSSVLHFLWPRWGFQYGLEVLKILEEPPFSGRPVLVHAASIGGYTFTQILTHIAQGQSEHQDLAQRVVGHIYDSLVVGTLEHMAVGLGKTLVPRLEGFIKNTVMLYFWLFKTHTADLYENSIRVFRNSPITAPALFFFCENDAMCNHVVLEALIDVWRNRGVRVASRKWKTSIHAGHMRCHKEDYLATLQHFLNSLSISSI
ncbi:uncharacterized protein KZ484_003008 [Pholidichthys leucotaenia]